MIDEVYVGEIFRDPTGRVWEVIEEDGVRSLRTFGIEGTFPAEDAPTPWTILLPDHDVDYSPVTG